MLSSIGTAILKVCEYPESVLRYDKTYNEVSCDVLEEEINLHIFLKFEVMNKKIKETKT